VPKANFSDAFEGKFVDHNTFGNVEIKDIDLKNDSGMFIYQKAKVLADKKVWEVAREHPDVDFTVSKSRLASL
jgi:hypothetical protein